MLLQPSRGPRLWPSRAPPECGCPKPGVGEHTFPGLPPCRGPGVQPRVAFATALPLATIPDTHADGTKGKRTVGRLPFTVHRGTVGVQTVPRDQEGASRWRGWISPRWGNSPSCLISESTVLFREMRRGKREVVASVAR